MTSFYELSRPARIARLRRTALAVLDRYGIEAQTLKFTSCSNIIYQVSDQHGQRYNLKFMIGINAPVARHDFVVAPWEGQVGTSLDLQLLWQEALARDTDLDLAAPRRTLDGEIAPRIHIDGLPEPIICVLSTWCPGRVFARSWSAPRPGIHYTHQIGRIAATLHNHAQDWPLPKGHRRPKAGWRDAATQVFEHVFAFLADQKALSDTQRRTMHLAADTILAAFNRLGAGKPHFGLIHEDIHPGNLILHRGRFALIDFNNAIFGYYLWDMVHLLCDTPNFNAPAHVSRYPAFFDGYREVRTLPDDYPQTVQAMVAFFFVSETFAEIIHSPDPGPNVLKYKLPRTLWMAERLVDGRPFPEL